MDGAETQELQMILGGFIEQERLPEAFRETAIEHYLPLAARVHGRRQRLGRSMLVGVNGAQGSGKSTMAALLGRLLEEHGYRVAILSIDDFYLDQTKRGELASEVHPLFRTRGVPGTHDISLLGEVIDELLSGARPLIPRFDKSTDNPVPEDQWQRPETPVDIVIFEGWCVGAAPMDKLGDPINELEEREDPEGVWRAEIQLQLSGSYQELFRKIDFLMMLRVPSFERVFQWRSLQERKLREKLEAEGRMDSATALMGEEQLKRFIDHYERLTRWMLEEMPSRADQVLLLSDERKLTTVPVPRKLLVVTDLDATLLDESYSYEAAKPALAKLQGQGAPVVFNSSKTLEEMKPLASEMGQRMPIVAENGGLLAIPNGDDYEVRILGLSRDDILKQAHALRDEHGFKFQGFADWNPATVMEHTGLSEESAKLSGKRLTTEPILWDDSEERFDVFCGMLAESGIRALRGGHFIHLMGDADKADGLLAVLRWFAETEPETDWMTVALGDSANDEQMLHAAELAFVLPGRRGGWIKGSCLQTRRVGKSGPQGWNEAILSLR
ncbi:HAD-IIB family hydrolase [Haloferula sp.]|uniref:HAD-IIB family hydrolase n=1 Tax=Haloferula sp. TaxID=2497595 RepID=UPI00329D6C94